MRHTFIVNDLSNGGEQVSITTCFELNDGKKVLSYQEIELGSYGNSAKFTLTSGMLTPSTLRELANQIEQAKNQ